MLRIAILFFLTFLFCPGAYAQQSKGPTLSIALMLNAEKEAKSYNLAVSRFEQLNPEIKVEVKYLTDLVYKSNIESWLRNADYDVLYWQAGSYRLKGFAQQNLLADLTSVWQGNQLDSNFSLNLKP